MAPPPAKSACFRMLWMRLKLAASGSKSGVGRSFWMRVEARFQVHQVAPAGGHGGVDFVVFEAADDP